MSTQQRQHVNVRDLAEEAKKRIVVLIICVVGLSYLMSLTSSSVWVNLPAAASLIIGLRYLSLDFDMRRKAAAYNSKPSSNTPSHKKPLERPKIVEKSEWRRKVNSPVVEDAIDHFTRHLVSEWITDLWYSRLTPDKEGPEELVNIMNGALGEISGRMRNINLIDLLTRDLVNLICTHLELFRANQAKIERQHSGPLTIEQRDVHLRRILANEDKLHPALFSAEAEHKVLQHLFDGLIPLMFKPEDLQCLFFRYIGRELLASAVMRPVFNLASPKFINERIEVLVLKMTKANKGVSMAQGASQSKSEESSRIPSDHFSRFLDPTVTGVELVQLKTNQSGTAANTSVTDHVNGNLSKDPLLSVDPRSTRSWNSLPFNSQTSEETGIQSQRPRGEWGDMLDLISRRKTQALAPEHFENMWAKGRNYRKKEGEKVIEQVPQDSSPGKSVKVDHSKAISKPKENSVIKNNHFESSTVHSEFTDRLSAENSFHPTNQNVSNRSSFVSNEEDDEHNLTRLEVDSGSSTSYTSEDDETNNVTGLGSPGTKVWDGRSKRNQAIPRIHHPLENFEGRTAKKTGKGHVNYRRLVKPPSGRRRSRSSSQKTPIWQEVERSSFLSGDGQDILNSAKEHANVEDSSEESEIENLGRIHSGAAASSSVSFFSIPESHNSAVKSLQNSLAVNSFFKLRCEVLGANIVKSGSKQFAVYSVSVTDVNNNSWSIKRRFRHFEELHRRLKEFPEYDLHLPPKHFLSTGLDVPVIQERCKLLDKYLKNLMQLPTISGSIEVWDFLSVDSQTYLFSNSFSVIETLSVDLEDKPSGMAKRLPNFLGPVTDHVSLRREHLSTESKESAFQIKNNSMADGLRSNEKDSRTQNCTASLANLGNTARGRDGDSLEEASESHLDAAIDPTLPTEWVPPNLSVPILDLVDVIFQVHDGGWIRRKAFWVAKQILQLGMGDAFDDWLIEKIQLLRKGSVIASGIRRVEQILWPDGIFISKHPKRRPPPSTNPSQNSPHGQPPTGVASPKISYEQQQEAIRRAKFVYELMIDNAPATIVGLVGRKEYEQCAKDLYFFIQSSVCLKLLAFDLLELVVLSAFPELDYVFKQFEEEKHKFGEFKEN
ncbi:hypothetical protein SO802_005568 [Lithocarpus litseifolius]|uniref:PXA domain-containing protein n=1 Tax=Lithocarpus litseifolius TaxID=425828 RepID=A0AAW2DMC8_9ROSI